MKSLTFHYKSSELMFMQSRVYYLVLPATAGPEYGGGWAPGSVITHWLHLSKGYPGVFWVWHLVPEGIENIDKPFFNELITIMEKPLETKRGRISISRRGFIYESEDHSITWEFEGEFARALNSGAR